MKAIVVPEAEFARAFDEAMLKVANSLREKYIEQAPQICQTVNYYLRELQSRLEGR